MDVLILASRYLRTRRLALVATLFLAVAVTAMIVITAVMAGFQARIWRHVRSMEPDLTIRLGQHPPPAPVSERIREELQGEMQDQGGPLLALAPRMQTVAILGNKLDEVSGVDRGQANSKTLLLVGIDYQRDRRVVSWHKVLAAVHRNPLDLASNRKGRVPPGQNPLIYYPEGGLLLSYDLAWQMRFVPGTDPDSISDATVVIGSFGRDERGRAVIEPANRTFTVAATFDSGRDEHDLGVVYVSLDAFRNLRYGDDPAAPDAAYMVARVAGNRDAEAVALELRRRHPSLLVETWRDHNRSLAVALKVEEAMTSAILFFVVILAALLLLGILYMIVMEKRRDIGILRSMGLSRGRTMGVFLAYGTMLGLIGVSLGTVVGILAVHKLQSITDWLARNLGVVIFQPSAYRQVGIPTVLKGEKVVLIALLALLVTMLAALVAAWKAAQGDPVESLQYE